MPVKKYSAKENEIVNDLTKWFSTSELLEYLGISEEELYKQSKLFSEGVHYKHEATNPNNSQTLWRLDLVDELLCLPIPPLEKEAMLKAINNDIKEKIKIIV